MAAEKFKIVVIDDDKGACLLVRKILEGTKKYSVVTSTDSAAAEDLCCREKPELVILDNIMPEIKGSELVKVFRRNTKLKKIPIVMVTGKGEMIYSDEKEDFVWNANNPLVKNRGELEEQKNPRSIEEAYGVDAYTTKPVKTRVLLGIIDDILIKKKEEDELEEWKRDNM